MKKYIVLLIGILFIVPLASAAPTHAQSISHGSLTFGTSPNTVTLDVFHKCVPGSSTGYRVEIYAFIRNHSGGTVNVTFEPITTSSPAFPNGTDDRYRRNNVPNNTESQFVNRFGDDDVDYTGVSVTFTVSGTVSGTQTLTSSFNAGCTPTAVSLTSTQATGSLPTWAYGIMLVTVAATGLVLTRRK